MKNELEHCQGIFGYFSYILIKVICLIVECIAAKNSQVDALQQSLEAIKFEKYCDCLYAMPD